MNRLFVLGFFVFQGRSLSKFGVNGHWSLKLELRNSAQPINNIGGRPECLWNIPDSNEGSIYGFLFEKYPTKRLDVG